MPDEVHGVLVIDKPRGPTSHDIVARLRRPLGTRRVGHAGTLDPMASGVLVVLAGEATKLAPYLTAHDKRYEARVVLGVGTDTFDADGEVTEVRALPEQLAGALARCSVHEAPAVAAALEAERDRAAQVPPAHSAIKIQGRRSYALARAGQEVDLSPRPVRVRALRLLRADPGGTGSPPTLDLELEVSKGYYVRALARDLGARLGVPAHLAALRRTASGAFTLARAVSPDADPDALRRALIPIEEAAALALPTARLTDAGARRAHLGQRLHPEHFIAPPPDNADEGAISAWLTPDGHLAAVGRAQGREATGPARAEPAWHVARGFSRVRSARATEEDKHG